MNPLSSAELSRREFVQAATAASAGWMLGASALAQDAAPPASADELKIALIGAGVQGRGSLLNDCLKIPGIRFVAVCDIWPYAQTYAANILKKYDQPVKTYADYQELLAQEKSLDAVLIATPDWVHSEQTVACLKAGKHVYCEKEMSNTVEGARAMVKAAQESGKLLQIGHQRRSNPRYWHALKLIDNDKVCGRVTHVNGQWNRGKRYDIGWPKGKELSADALKKYGYDTMERFANWRWYKQYSGGPMADLGSHQVDVYSWFLKSNPRAVLASGGADYYTDREWYDNVLSIYEYEIGGHVVRAFYQVLNTSSHGGFYECFMGDQGSLVVSEDQRKAMMFREPDAKRREWEDESEKIENMDREAITLKIGQTLDPSGQPTAEGQKLLEQSKKPEHQLHLENFFAAVRTGSPLSCPGEVGFETCVTVLKANEAVAAGQRVAFDPAEFKV